MVARAAVRITPWIWDSVIACSSSLRRAVVWGGRRRRPWSPRARGWCWWPVARPSSMRSSRRWVRTTRRAFVGDLSDPATAEGAVALALQTWSRLDGALISVGGPPAGSVADTTEEQWRAAFESVFLAGLRVNDAVVRHGTAPDLAIAWVLSTSSKSPVPGLAASNGLRPGLAMLVKQLADELGPRGIRILGLMPGRVETERVQHLDSLADDPKSGAGRGGGGHPVAAVRSSRRSSPGWRRFCSPPPPPT